MQKYFWLKFGLITFKSQFYYFVLRGISYGYDVIRRRGILYLIIICTVMSRSTFFDSFEGLMGLIPCLRFASQICFGSCRFVKQLCCSFIYCCTNIGIRKQVLHLNIQVIPPQSRAGPVDCRSLIVGSNTVRRVRLDGREPKACSLCEHC